MKLLTRFLPIAAAVLLSLLGGDTLFAQTEIDISRTPAKYKIHFTDASVVVQTKKDVQYAEYSDGWFFVNMGDKYRVYNKDGNLRYTDFDPFWAGTLRVENGLIITQNGHILDIIKNETVGNIGEYSACTQLVDGIGAVKRTMTDKSDNSWYYIYDFFNEKGEPVRDQPIQASRYSYDLKEPSPLVDGRRALYAYELQLWGYMDENCNIPIYPAYTGAHDFSEGLAAVQKVVDGEYKWGFIDTEGNEVIPFRFSKEPGDFLGGVAVVEKKNGKKTLLNKDGTTVDAEIDVLFPRWNDHLVMGYLNPMEVYLITPSGNKVLKGVNLGRCGYVTDGPVAMFQEGMNGPVISYDGEVLLRERYLTYIAEGYFSSRYVPGYSLVIFNYKGEVILAFQTIQDEF